MTDTYGPTSAKQFAHYDPDTHSWKTWPDIGLWDSITYSQTVPPTGYMSDGQAYEHHMSVHHTTVKDSSSSYLPTPKASDGMRQDSPAERRRRSPSLPSIAVMMTENSGHGHELSAAGNA